MWIYSYSFLYEHNSCYALFQNQNVILCQIYKDAIPTEFVNNLYLFFHSFSRPLLTTAAVLAVIIMIVGVLGNLLTIVALLRCPKVRNVAAAFIIR